MAEEQNTDNSDVNADQNNNNQESGTNTDTSTENAENMIPKSRFDSVNEKKKAAEKELQEVANMLTEDVPEDFKDIIPDLPPSQKIKWIKNAQKKGLFSKQAQESPDNETPGKTTTKDFSNLPTSEKMKAGYKQ